VTAALKIVEPGIAAALQDRGRPGRQRFGVPISGAIDAESLAIANTLVGNDPGTGAIEMLGAGLALEIEADTVTVALAGMVRSMSFESGTAAVRVPAFQTLLVKRGDILRVPAPEGGAAAYLAVEGGFDVPFALGSQSTYRRAALGGFHGRALSAGDRLPLRLISSERLPLRLSAAIRPPEKLRVMRGPNAKYFTSRAFETLFGSEYTVTPASDRMGLRLKGPVVERAINGELTSEGTTPGGMQVPSDGQPIMLLADRQTTGGYPRIATVISADLAAAGRLAAGSRVRFVEVNRDEAVQLLKSQRDWLASLPSLLTPAAPDPLSAERLLSENLIGGVTAGTSGPEQADYVWENP
jgi:5-oxoprolinase (ATP-hydrolysing) subunit C